MYSSKKLIDPTNINPSLHIELKMSGNNSAFFEMLTYLLLLIHHDFDNPRIFENEQSQFCVFSELGNKSFGTPESIHGKIKNVPCDHTSVSA